MFKVPSDLISRDNASMMSKTLACIAVSVSMTAFAACRGEPPQVITVPTPDLAKRGGMTITGTATLEVSPDCADLTMTISFEGTRPGIVTSTVQAKQKELLAGLRAVGVNASDIKLSQLTLRQIDTRDVVPARPVGYRGEVTVMVTTRQFDKVGTLMEAGANAGATSMSSQFRRSDMPEQKKKVREMALRAAQEKAAQTAKVLGIELGRIIAVAEAPAGRMWGAGPYSNYVGNSPTAPSSDGAIGGEAESLTLDITIDFELPGKV
jgi:uncharacterized protein YggE